MEFHDRVIGVEELRRENRDRYRIRARDRIRVGELAKTANRFLPQKWKCAIDVGLVRIRRACTPNRKTAKHRHERSPLKGSG